jgi:transcription initiation factor TFIIH subunit 1
VRLKLGLVGDDAGHNFTFTSPQPVAYTEREKFKKELTVIISRNRSGLDHALKPPVTALSSTPSNAPTPRPLLAASRPSTSRAASVSSESRSPVILGDDPAREFRLRKKILISNPDLGALHRELVMNGPITEAEFWDGREVSPQLLSSFDHRCVNVRKASSSGRGCSRSSAEGKTWSTCGSPPRNRGRR